MIQKKSLKDAIQNPEIISVVGGLIGVATTEKNGLYPSTEVKKTQRVNSLSPGQIVDTGLNSGLIVIGSSITSGSAVFCFGFNKTDRIDVVASEAFNINNVYVYKDSNNGNILIKNNKSDTLQVWFSIVTGI